MKWPWQHREDDTEARAVLTTAEHKQASRLSKLTGKTRDEVLREAYRKSDAMMADYDLAESHRLGGK